MILSFRGSGTEDIFNGRDTRAARRTCPTALWRGARRKLEQLDSTIHLDDLRVPPGNRLEALTGDRDGELSMRINDQYRICFRWTAQGPESVEVVDSH